jgi:hypothetical protein
LISEILDAEVLYFHPFEARIWTWLIFRKGHLVNRHSLCPEWLGMRSIIGDQDIDEFSSEGALRAFRRTWEGDAGLVARLFSATRLEFETYLRHFTVEELDELDEGQKKRYADCKANRQDRFSVASPWAFLHLIERLGYPEFPKIYWDLADSQALGSANTIYSPSEYRRPAEGRAPPPCARDPYSGFFWGHDWACPRTND